MELLEQLKSYELFYKFRILVWKLENCQKIGYLMQATCRNYYAAFFWQSLKV